VKAPLSPLNKDAQRLRLLDALGLIVEQDRSGLRNLYELTSAKLFGICLRISADRQAAEDILQDVYIKVWNRAELFDPSRGSPMTWLCTIARNSSLDWRRAHGSHAQMPLEAARTVADESPTADSLIEQSELSAQIFDCIEQLDPQPRNAIRMAFFDGFTYAELALRMSVPLGTMKSWIRRGMQQLKGCIGDG
jgi:RNA polymerase sigma-70 factor (ECF subfamily)